jgi:DNA-directed RNA polymerase specialized sigma24 family protein
MQSDSDLLLAIQSGGPNSKRPQEQLFPRFGKFLVYVAGFCCTHKPDEASDIVGLTVARLLDPAYARFDGVRGATDGHCLAYLRFMVQNAARDHLSSLRYGTLKMHKYKDADNARQSLPTNVGEIADPAEVVYSDEQQHTDAVAAAALAMAPPDLRACLVRVFFGGESVKDVAISVGIDRSTLSHRFSVFYAKVRVALRRAS